MLSIVVTFVMLYKAHYNIHYTVITVHKNVEDTSAVMHSDITSVCSVIIAGAWFCLEPE